MSWVEGLRESLRGQLSLRLAAGIVAMLGLSFFGLHVLIRNAIYAHVDEDLLLQMRAVAAYAVAHPGKESIAEFMPRFRARAHRDFFQVWDGEGRVLARSNSSAGKDLPHLAFVVGKPTYYDLRLPDGHDGRAVSEAFRVPPGDSRGLLEVVTAEETEPLLRLQHHIHVVLLSVALATLVAALAIARYSVVRGLRPVGDLVRSLERIDLDDPQARLDPGPLPSELRPVASTFTSLLNRLLEGLARERRYARNVAHELRNPLAEMRLLADVGSTADEVEAMRAVVREIGATAVEMQQIVDSLMALTRYEAGLETLQTEPVDLCDRVRRHATAMKAAADQKNLGVELDLPGEVWVHTDNALASRLVANLLGNAIAHAPRGSVVRVRVDVGGGLQISNPAPQLQADDLPRLGERFFRIGTGDVGPHAGLGLSLATAIARVLGLRLDLELSDDGRLVVTVSGFRTLT